TAQHTTNVDQLHAYLGQHEFHANEVHLMHKRNLDPLALVANHQMTQSHTQSSTPLSITYLPNDFQSSVHHNVYNPSSSIPQVEFAPSVNQQSDFSQPDSGLILPMFQKGDDLIDAINHMMSFLTTVVTSRHLKEKESLKQTVTLLKNDFQKEESRNIDRELALEKHIKELNNIVFKRNQSTQTVDMLTKPQFLYDHTTKQALAFQNPFYLKKAHQLEPKLYDETLMLIEESRSNMLLKQKDPMMSEKKVNTKPVDYAALNQRSQDFETRFVP
nr:hypothetical protein [Tanacetum cinerariifolium]